MAEKSVLVAVLEGRTPSIVIASDFCTETVFAEQSPEMAEKSVLEAVLEGRTPSIVIASEFCTETVFAEQSPKWPKSRS